MSRRLRVQLSSGVLVVAVLGAVSVWLFPGLWGPHAQEPEGGAVVTTPALFALDYATGHDRAGFAARAMVLVFGEGGFSAWNEFFTSCEQDPRLTELLSTRFQGV